MATANKESVTHMEASDEHNAHVASLGNAEEHDLGKWAALKTYPKACFWSIFSVWVILLSSFENQAAGVILGIPKFREDFGHRFNNEYVIDANWQGAFNGAPVAAAVIGALGGGELADIIGRKRVIMICLLISFGAITMEFLSTTPELFFGGKFLNGFSIGALQSITVTYIGEVTPLAVRGLFTCLSALAYTIGPLCVALIVNETGEYNNRWAYRAVFVSQYGFAGVSACLVWFMPESPWWLASKDRDEQALKSLNGLGYTGADGTTRLAVIKRTLAEISSETSGVTYFECFRNSNLRRTIISISPLCIQSLSGIVFVASYATYYMQRAGYSTEMSFKLQIVQQVISLVGNVMSWYLVDRMGRRSLTWWGLLVLTVILFVTGGLAVAADANPEGTEVKATVAFILIYCWWYNVTIGATAYTVLCEVSTSRLRVKTIAIGLAVFNCLNMIWSFVLPYMFNPDQANLGAKIAFIYGGLSALSLVYLWYYLPETAGRTFEELDEMFVKKVPARKFKSYTTDTAARGQAVRSALESKEEGM